ncbi:MAG: hypothetical protein ACAI44_35470 [Candidatus Sericytochromatia bacterium]
MQKKSIVTYLAVTLAAVASFALVHATPAQAATPSVEVHLNVSHAGEDIEAEELQEAIETYLTAHKIEVEDDGDVELNINIEAAEDGESFTVSYEWDKDPAMEDTDEYEVAADDLGEAIVADLDEFIEDITDGNVDDEDNSDADEGEDEDEDEDE